MHLIGAGLQQAADKAALPLCRRIVKLPPDVVGGVVNAIGLLPPQLDMDRVAEDRDAVLLRFQEADEVGCHVQLAPLQQHCNQGVHTGDTTVYFAAFLLTPAVEVAVYLIEADEVDCSMQREPLQ